MKQRPEMRGTCCNVKHCRRCSCGYGVRLYGIGDTLCVCVCVCVVCVCVCVVHVCVVHVCVVHVCVCLLTLIESHPFSYD